MRKLFCYDTKIGKIAIAEKQGFITNVYFSNMKLPQNVKILETDIIKLAYLQITDYLNGVLSEFDIPINPSGTDFEQRIWCGLLTIPYGHTKTYKAAAEAAGNVKAVRAAGNACHRNPVPIIIPCHRIIASDGKLSGYAGGMYIKSFLLELEKCNMHKFL